MNIGQAPSNPSLSILLVEDDSTLRELLARALSQRGFDVSSAATCFEALRELQQSRFDLVISDFHLPDGTGLRLYTFLRKDRSAVPFILTSGDFHVTLGDSRFQFLAKPFTTEQLARAIVAVRDGGPSGKMLHHIQGKGAMACE